jgi:excisionase family DNA binding protein
MTDSVTPGMIPRQGGRQQPILSQPRPDKAHQEDIAPGSVLAQILSTVLEIRALLAGTRKPYYAVEEVARLTGRSGYTVRRWIAEHRIQATRVAGTGPKGRLLIAATELDKLIATGQGSQVPTVCAGNA